MYVAYRVSETGRLCRGVWFPAHSNITCTGKGAKIESTNQWTRISSYDDFIG